MLARMLMPICCNCIRYYSSCVCFSRCFERVLSSDKYQTIKQNPIHTSTLLDNGSVLISFCEGYLNRSLPRYSDLRVELKRLAIKIISVNALWVRASGEPLYYTSHFQTHLAFCELHFIATTRASDLC